MKAKQISRAKAEIFKKNRIQDDPLKNPYGSIPRDPWNVFYRYLGLYIEVNYFVLLLSCQLNEQDNCTNYIKTSMDVLNKFLL